MAGRVALLLSSTTSPVGPFILLLCLFCVPTPVSTAGDRPSYSFCQVPGTTPTAGDIIKIGVILPFKPSFPWSFPRAGPGIHYAVETICNQTDLLPGKTFEIYEGDSQCSDTYGPLEAIDMYLKRTAHVFLGPACDYAVAPIARFSPSWNIPIITGGALVTAFRDKKQYRLMTRISGSYAKMGDYMARLFSHFDWAIPGLIYNTNLGRRQHLGKTNCFFTMEAIYLALTPGFKKKVKDPDQDIWYKDFDEKGPKNVNFTSILQEASTRSRIVVLCASPKSVRNIMIKAADLHFDNGEYVFFNIDLFSSKNQSEKPWFDPKDPPEINEKARRAYDSLMTVTLRKPDSEEYKKFSKEVKRRAQEQYNNFTYGEEEVNSFVGAFHDAVILYALALNETLAAGYNATDGAEITHRMWNKTFKGITGPVSIDENGDRDADYSLLDMDPKTGKFQVVANYFGNTKKYEEVKAIHWAGGRDRAPPDTPECGFDGSGCPPHEPFPEYAIVIIVLGSLLLIVSLAAFFIYRENKLKAAFAEVNWRVEWEEIMFSATEKRKLERSGSRMSLTRKVIMLEHEWRVDWEVVSYEPDQRRRLTKGKESRLRSASARVSMLGREVLMANSQRMSMQSNISGDTIAVHLSDLGNKQVYTKTGYYKSTLVAIKKINKANINITKPLLMEFKRMRDLQNDHIVRFIGVCIDPPNQCILTEYCQKGSLQDVLENEQIKLDFMFKFSLMQDIVRALAYLHSSEIRSHGNLKSSNCVVDSRFVLKITDFGLQSLRGREEPSGDDSYAYYKKNVSGTDMVNDHYRGKLWTAPEVLRMHNPPAEGTQKGDVYSFAIICQEIIYRNGPFWMENKDSSPQDIYRDVKNGQKPYTRPTLEHIEEEDYREELVNMITKCWSEDPYERPDFHSLKTIIRKINKDGDTGNILDNLLNRMEQYANNLEGLVEERTADYLEQKKRAEDLLYMMLPRSVAGQLMRGESVTAEKFDNVTIYFSDIVGFTSLSARSSPLEVVDLLNDLYTTFDSIIVNFDVYKVETIGDAYMVVSGLPIRNENKHAREICRMSLALLIAVKSFKIRHCPGEQLKIRIGIHSGPVVAGVVGLKMPRYCLFGDTVNTSSRMESNGEALKIHVSPKTKDILDTFGTFLTKDRGAVEMKGLGAVYTYWLVGERNEDHPDWILDWMLDT